MQKDKKFEEFIKKYEICDAHGHIFPDKIAKKAVTAIGDFYDLPMDGCGSVSAIKESAAKINASHILVCSTATVPHQVESINAFIANTCKENPEFVGFGSLHPDYENSFEQAKFLIDNGLKGIKLHPDFQKFNIDDKRAYHIYDVAQSLNLPVLFHMGDDRYDFSSPIRLKKVLRDFPNLVAFAAHFGGYRRWDEALEFLAGEENVYYDTSSSLHFFDVEYGRKLVSKFGDERLFFGCDFPMWNHDEELKRFINLNLTDEQNEKILSKNFKKFFKL